ncbi:hypothetical protein E8E14_000383 [Neopestalotiopsis sp. 37M]|nr:hypothetical protein E8E14_000383 [Neopestalotiopsis sp. 37M]
MDHLPPILDPVEPYPKPPFLGYICTFDGGQFTTFPERCGWKLEGENNFSDRLLRKDGVELGHLETSAFIQAWLFFGLLFEVFKIIDVPLNEEDSIRKDDTGTSVTTEMLPTYIQKWGEREHSRSSEGNPHNHLRLDEKSLDVTGSSSDPTQNLFWQFKEDALSAEEIWRDHFDQAPCHISYRTSAFDKRLPYFSGNTKSPSDLSNIFLELVNALRYRSLSRVEGETIFMAPILGLDRAPLFKQEGHVQRMQMFFHLWQNIPSYILFMEGERLSQPGSRWMPLSFVRGAHKTTVTRVSPQFTTFEPRGLLLSYPGLILPVSDARLAEYCDVGFWNRFDSKWYRIRDTGPVFESKLPIEQRWSHWKPILSTFHHPAFVLEYHSYYSHNYIVAVLVDITEEANGLNYADFKARVWLDECNAGRRFETQSETDSVEIWLEGMYREYHDSDSKKARPGAQGGYLPPKDAFHTTTLQQRWCIG